MGRNKRQYPNINRIQQPILIHFVFNVFYYSCSSNILSVFLFPISNISSVSSQNLSNNISTPLQGAQQQLFGQDGLMSTSVLSP